MEQLPPRGRPVTERESCVVSPDVIQRLHCLLKELYAQRSIWRKFLQPQSPPHHDTVREMLTSMKKVESLHGAKVLCLDDTSQLNLPFFTQMTLATCRRVERIFYHGEPIDEIVHNIRERIQRCPRVHLLIADGVLNMLPSLACADHTVYGHEVLAQLSGDLQTAGIPSMGYSSTTKHRKDFMNVGADAFIRKTIPAASAVELIAHNYQIALERIRRRREERFIMED